MILNCQVLSLMWSTWCQICFLIGSVCPGLYCNHISCILLTFNSAFTVCWQVSLVTGAVVPSWVEKRLILTDQCLIKLPMFRLQNWWHLETTWLALTSVMSFSGRPMTLLSIQVFTQNFSFHFWIGVKLHKLVPPEDPENENYQALATRLWPQYLVGNLLIAIRSCILNANFRGEICVYMLYDNRCKIEKRRTLFPSTLKTWWLVTGRRVITGRSLN